MGPVRALLEALLSSRRGFHPTVPGDDLAAAVEQVNPKVLVVVYNPVIEAAGGRRLSELFQWNRSERLISQYIADVRHASYGYCNYQVVKSFEVDAFPVKIDGFTYTGEAYTVAWRARSGFHQPDWADYDRIVSDFNLVERINDDQIDEVWLFAFPYAGFYESRMAGPGAFWCNAPPLPGYQGARKRFVIMGFNYERGVGEMLESFGHRAESIMAHVFRHKYGDDNLWDRFTRYDKTHPGMAEVGNVHFAPNSSKDYDWGNRSMVQSRCDNWYNFPALDGPAGEVNCREWGNGDTRLHHLWWLRHFPHVAGASSGVSNNWWEYVIDPQRVR